ncbi:uncharacterized protein ACRADG_003231 [Cochliomyia hominivorax]
MNLMNKAQSLAIPTPRPQPRIIMSHQTTCIFAIHNSDTFVRLLSSCDTHYGDQVDEWIVSYHFIYFVVMENDFMSTQRLPEFISNSENSVLTSRIKFLLIAFALIGLAAAATLPDSATQGPNPQDIATPEPEYIDIDLPEPAPAPKPAPVPKVFGPVPRPIQRPVQTFSANIVPQIQPQLPGHLHGQNGYQYRRPVYIRRVHRRY